MISDMKFTSVYEIFLYELLKIEYKLVNDFPIELLSSSDKKSTLELIQILSLFWL